MRLLLDTHVLLWWLRDRAQIGARARSLIASPEVEVLVSVCSGWEIAIKARLGKLEVTSDEVFRHVRAEGFGIVPIETAHVAGIAALPQVDGHRDPFDHLLLAQAVAERAVLMTADRILSRYRVPCISVR